MLSSCSNLVLVLSPTRQTHGQIWSRTFSIEKNLSCNNTAIRDTDTVWDELSATSSQNLQRLQNRAARIVLRRDFSKDAFNVLGWTKLETKRKRHKCVLVSDYFTRNYILHSYNTRRKTDLHLPKVKLSLAKRTFRYSGSALFNVLPRSMQKAESLSSFKILINTHNF